MIIHGESVGPKLSPEYLVWREMMRRCYKKTRKEQANNRRPRTNVIGMPGAQPCRDKYKAQIRVGGRTVHLGVFDTPEAASAAFLRAKSELI